MARASKGRRPALNKDQTQQPDVESHETDEPLAPQNILDSVEFGRRLRALRILNGYDRMADFAHVLRSRYGVDVSDRTIYAIERGEQMPHLDLFFAAIAALKPAHRYFDPAIRYDVASAIADSWMK